MGPAQGWLDRPWASARLIEFIVAAIRIGLQDAGIARQMPLRMLAPAIPAGMEQGRRSRIAAERLIVAHVDPGPPGIGLALGQDRHGGIVAMQPRGGHDMGCDQIMERSQDHCRCADLVGQS